MTVSGSIQSHVEGVSDKSPARKNIFSDLTFELDF